MNSYQGARKIHRYLMTHWADDIRDRGGDAPIVFGKTKWARSGIGGGEGSAIVWEGFYEWTRHKEIEVMENLLDGSGLEVFPGAEWYVEIF
jgi:hypothetical protein